MATRSARKFCLCAESNEAGLSNGRYLSYLTLAQNLAKRPVNAALKAFWPLRIQDFEMNARSGVCSSEP